MDEGAQEDEQFQMEIDNEETDRRSEGSSASKNSEEEEVNWKSRRDSNRVE